MTLIVAPEDGYDSLVSLLEASAYMEKFGLDWSNHDAAKHEVALRRATQYLLTAYDIKQEYLAPVVHQRVKYACCEAAHRAVKNQLVADTDGRIVTEQTVDVITTKYDVGQQSGQLRYPVIDNLLRGLTSWHGSLNVRLVRG